MFLHLNTEGTKKRKSPQIESILPHTPCQVKERNRTNPVVKVDVGTTFEKKLNDPSHVVAKLLRIIRHGLDVDD